MYASFRENLHIYFCFYRTYSPYTSVTYVYFGVLEKYRVVILVQNPEDKRRVLVTSYEFLSFDGFNTPYPIWILFV